MTTLVGASVVCGILAPTQVPGQMLPGRNVNMVSGTEYPGGDPYLQRQNEPSCAVSTRDPRHVLCGGNDYRSVDIPGLPEGKVTGDAWLGLFKSFDGGHRWQSTLLSGFPQDVSSAGFASPLRGYEAGADPIVRSAHNGLFYYSGIVFNREEHGLGASFVARFIDLNNKEGAAFDVVSERDPIVPAGILLTDTGNASQFIDKPWLATDVPRADALLCHIVVQQTVRDPDGTVRTEEVTQQFPGGRVYQSYSTFVGEDKKKARTKVMFTRSQDCGATWSKPLKVSEGFPLNQGTVLAIDPADGTVYLAWRQFATVNEPDAIVLVKSVDGGRTFTKGRVIATIDPFEQGTSEVSARTAAFPAMTVDGGGRVYVAWSERVAPHNDGRIVMMSSGDRGATWTEPVPIADREERGHQFMPSLSFGQGYLSVAYYEQLWDHTRGELECPAAEGCTNIGEYVERRYPTGDLADPTADPAKVFNECLIDVAPRDVACDLTDGWDPLKRRHTLDVFATRARPAAHPTFETPVPVSRYLYGARPGSSTIEQLQYNPPNLPLFRKGEAAFVGDYVDLAGSPPFVYDQSAGRWLFNSEPGDSTVLHLAWTDNRDVRPPPPGKSWADYTPPEACPTPGTCQSQFDPAQEVPPCDPDASTAGTRNQNVYSARLSDGLVASALQNTKRLGRVNIGPYENVRLQRAFAIVVENEADETRHFRLTIDAPTNAVASFLQFGLPLMQLDVSVARRSSIARTVYVMADDPAASVRVDVSRIDAIAGSVIPADAGGLTGGVVLNPDALSPDITNPDIPDLSPDITNPDIGDAETYSPDILSGPVLSPDITNVSPDITNPDIPASDLDEILVVAPDITNPDLGSLSPDITNPPVSVSDLTNYTLTSPDITNGTLLDATWRIVNRGNTGAVYDVKLLRKEAVPAGFRLQLLLHKVYTTPEALGCELREEAQTIVVANIPDPYTSPDITNLSPDITNPGVENATMALGPGEEGRITLRIWDPDKTDDVTAEEYIEENGVVPLVAPEPVDSEEAAGALYGPEPPPGPRFVAPTLVVATGLLPPASQGAPYSTALSALGGESPYRWSVSSGFLPPGLVLASDGVVSGTPTASGAFTFTVQVEDGSGAIASRALQIQVSPLPPIVLDPPTGTALGGEPFPGTRAIEVEVVSPVDVVLQAMTLRGVHTALTGILKATVYSDAGTVVATASRGVRPVESTVTVPVSAALHPGARYRLAFSVTVPGGGASIDGMDAAPPGADVDPYIESSGSLRVLQGWSSASDTFPSTRDPLVPYVTVTAGRAGLSFVTQPASAVANQSLEPAVAVRLTDATGAAVPGATITMAMEDNPGGATLSGGIVGSTDGAGFATFASLRLDKPGGCYTLRASAGSVVAVSDGFNVSGFRPLGSSTARSHAAVTRLHDGRILVVGGSGPTALATADTYDPWSGALTATGPLAEARSGPGAVTLQDGRVLVIGGLGASGPLATAEFYDPGAGTFGPAPTLSTPRWNHTTTMLGDGKVLVAGGGPLGGILNTAELYDPGTSSFRALEGNLSAGRFAHTATLLADGNVLLAGGWDGGGTDETRLAEVYEAADEIFTRVGDMQHGRFGHRAVLLPDGRVLIVGGTSLVGLVDAVEIYEPATQTFSVNGTLLAGRVNPTVVLLPSGRVLVAGGTDGSLPLSSAEIYDPATGTSSNAGDMSFARVGHVATLLPNSEVLILGGEDSVGYVTDTESYASADPPFCDVGFRLTGSLADARQLHSATRLADGRVLVIGGLRTPVPGGPSDYLDTTEIYDPLTGAFSTGSSLSEPRFNQEATLLPDGRVLVSGGQDDAAVQSVYALIYDPATDSFSNVAPAPRVTDHTATRLTTGEVLVAGGMGVLNPENAAYLFEATTGFTSAATMSEARVGHSATLLPDGRVLVVGGESRHTMAERTAEIFDRASSTFALVPDLLDQGRRDHEAVLLPTGRVLVTGGSGLGGDSLASAEIYDPVTGAFAPAGVMNHRRGPGHTLTLLPNGKVLVAGGWDSVAGEYVEQAEIYDPATGAFTAADRLEDVRGNHTTTLLSDGRILLVGGETAPDAALASAEVYRPGR